jgi:16S rRNA (adenine1518-N6/adenine1519-N6)-dimethyltransferase
VIELDRDLVPNLQRQFANYEQFHIHEADALKFDYQTLLQQQKK